MAYYVAASLLQLRNEINAVHPRRDHTSDGTIGDASHAARVSDHNPDYAAGGVVRALDVDKDGIDIQRLWNVVTRDPRTEYVIWNHRIYTRQNGFRAAVYTGDNPHDKHMHISIQHTKEAEAGTPWGYLSTAPAPAGRKTVDQIAQEVVAGKWGNNPERSRRLQAAGYSPSAVQAAVNNRLGGSGANRPVRLSVEAVAKQVINGQWGNGLERRRRIIAAGYDYEAVRVEVNRQMS